MKYLLIVLSFLTVTAGWSNNALPSIPGKMKKNNFCDAVNHKFTQFGWNNVLCTPEHWKTFDYTPRGNPLFYEELGFHDTNNDSPVNLLLCGVHGDEPSGVYICFQLVREILLDNQQDLNDIRLVIAPIVNPDGFFAGTRENANGVDPNRNLPTKDWDRLAQDVWIKYNRDPRKFPGTKSGTEAESRLQIYLINKYKPDKIISVHAPLGFLDFDGPGDQKYRNLVRLEKRAKYLGLNIEANSKNLLKLVDFRFFPGSLGNYAGNERKIPTYTIELPSSDPSEARGYWASLHYALLKALRFQVYDKEEMKPLFNDDILIRQAVNTKPETVGTLEGQAKKKDPLQPILAVNRPNGGRVLVIAGLLTSFVAFQLVILQRKQPLIERSVSDSRIPASVPPVSTHDENANPVISARPRYLSKKECDALIGACEPHLKPIIITALNTGMKKVELLNLKWEDIDFEHGCIILDRTTKNQRTIPLNDILKQTLTDIQQSYDVPFVFYNRTTCKPYRNISKSFLNALRRANIKNVHFGDLRHTFASHLINEGVDIKSIMKLLGYKSAKATWKYSSLIHSCDS